MDKNDNKTVAQNKKAYHDYFVLEEYEAGIELFGTEIKSIRQGKINLKDAWCNIVDGEIFVNGMHISPYDHGNIFNRDPMRVRKLLMLKKESCFSERSSRTDFRSFPSRFISRKAEQKLRSVFAKVKNYMISVTLPPKRMPQGTLNVQ